MFGRRAVLGIVVLVSVIGHGTGLGAQSPVPVLHIAPAVRIDSAAGLAGLVSWVTVSPSGIVAVANMVARTVQFFSPEGKRLGAYDGAASGMGTMYAFRSWVGDTLVVTVGNSYVRIGPDRVARELPTPSWDGRSPFPDAMLANGLELAKVDSARLPAKLWAARPPNAWALARVSPLGEFRGVVAWIPYGDCARDGRVSSFCLTPMRNMFNDSRALALITFDTPGPDSGTYRVTIVRPGGDTVFSRTYAYLPVRLSAEDAIHDGQGNPEYPPLGQVLVGRDGTVWLASTMRRPVPATEQKWTVLAPNGDLLGALSLPTGVIVQDADRSGIWVLESIGGAQPGFDRSLGPSRARPAVVVRYKVVVGSGAP